MLFTVTHFWKPHLKRDDVFWPTLKDYVPIHPHKIHVRSTDHGVSFKTTDQGEVRLYLTNGHGCRHSHLDKSVKCSYDGGLFEMIALFVYNDGTAEYLRYGSGLPVIESMYGTYTEDPNYLFSFFT